MLTEIEARADLIAILCDGALAAFGTLDALRRSSHLPYRLRLQVQVDSVGAIAEAIGRDFALDRVDGGVMDFVCPMPDKMAIVRRVAALNGVVRDVDILPPGLEDIYAHFVDERRSR
jgi:Cu-processing system ATP-binding protein